MNVIIQTALGLTDISSLVGFWRIKKLKMGILVVLCSYGFLLMPLLAGTVFGYENGDVIIYTTIAGLTCMILFRMFFLYEWTTKFNAQKLNDNNSELQ